MNYIEQFNKISEYLKEKNLIWLVDQVRKEISEGKLIKKKTKSLEFVGSDKDILKERVFVRDKLTETGRKREIYTREDLNDREKLLVLVSAIKRVFLDSQAIEKNVFDFMEEEHRENGLDHLVFISEEGVHRSEIHKDKLFDPVSLNKDMAFVEKILKDINHVE